MTRVLCLSADRSRQDAVESRCDALQGAGCEVSSIAIDPQSDQPLGEGLGGRRSINPIRVAAALHDAQVLRRCSPRPSRFDSYRLGSVSALLGDYLEAAGVDHVHVDGCGEVADVVRLATLRTGREYSLELVESVEPQPRLADQLADAAFAIAWTQAACTELHRCVDPMRMPPVMTARCLSETGDPHAWATAFAAAMAGRVWRPLRSVDAMLDAVAPEPAGTVFDEEAVGREAAIAGSVSSDTHRPRLTGELVPSYA